MPKTYEEQDLDKAEYLINYGYMKDKDMYELAEILYFHRINLVKPSGWQAPTHSDNVGMLSKVYDE